MKATLIMKFADYDYLMYNLGRVYLMLGTMKVLSKTPKVLQEYLWKNILKVPFLVQKGKMEKTNDILASSTIGSYFRVLENLWIIFQEFF